LASSLLEKGLLDLRLNLLDASSLQLQTASEVSINEGEPTRLVDSILLTIPTSIRPSMASSTLFSPQHIFPLRHQIKDPAEPLTRSSREYLSRLLAESTESRPELLLRWYDLNLLLALLEEVDEDQLVQLVSLLRRDLDFGHRAPSAEFLFLIASLGATCLSIQG
jgi:hypothetical protein